MSVLCAVGSRPFLVLPAWLCPLVPAALAASPRDALQRGVAFVGHEEDVRVWCLCSRRTSRSCGLHGLCRVRDAEGAFGRRRHGVDCLANFLTLVARQQIRIRASVFGPLEDFNIFLRVSGIGS